MFVLLSDLRVLIKNVTDSWLQTKIYFLSKAIIINVKIICYSSYKCYLKFQYYFQLKANKQTNKFTDCRQTDKQTCKQTKNITNKQTKNKNSNQNKLEIKERIKEKINRVIFFNLSIEKNFKHFGIEGFFFYFWMCLIFFFTFSPIHSNVSQFFPQVE